MQVGYLGDFVSDGYACINIEFLLRYNTLARVSLFPLFD